MNEKMTHQELRALLDLYYDGGTTREQERMLADSLFAGPALEWAEFDPDRAVLSYLAQKRSHAKAAQTRQGRRWSRVWQAAAVVAVAVMAAVGVSRISTPKADCWMSMNGQMIYSEEKVEQQMQANLAMALTDFTTVEDELSIMFAE